MKTLMRLQIAALSLMIVLPACGDDEETPAPADTTCTAGEQACEGEQIKTCLDDGTWGAAEDCDAGMACSEGHEGMEFVHCMEDDHGDHDGGSHDDHDGTHVEDGEHHMDDGMNMDDAGPMPMDGFCDQWTETCGDWAAETACADWWTAAADDPTPEEDTITGGNKGCYWYHLGVAQGTDSEDEVALHCGHAAGEAPCVDAEADPCADVTCDEGETCVDGTCEADEVDPPAGFCDQWTAACGDWSADTACTDWWTNAADDPTPDEDTAAGANKGCYWYHLSVAQDSAGDDDAVALHCGHAAGADPCVDPEADPCADVTCADGETCVDGTCEGATADPCDGVTCADGQTCVDGTCEADEAACVPFSDVQAVFANYSCTGCHGGSGGLALGSHADVITGGNAGSTVVAGDSGASNLYLKMTATPPFGSQMPTNGTGPVSDADLATVAAWIDGGAVDTCD